MTMADIRFLLQLAQVNGQDVRSGVTSNGTAWGCASMTSRRVYARLGEDLLAALELGTGL
jgi:hypothetical protein